MHFFYILHIKKKVYLCIVKHLIINPKNFTQ